MSSGPKQSKTSGDKSANRQDVHLDDMLLPAKHSSGSWSSNQVLSDLDERMQITKVVERATEVSQELQGLIRKKELPLIVRRAAVQTAWYVDTPKMLELMSRVIREEGHSLPLDAARWFSLSSQSKAEQEAIKMLNSKVARIRKVGTWALTGARSSEAEAALLSALDDKSQSVQLGAIRALSARNVDHPEFQKLSPSDKLNLPELSDQVLDRLLNKLLTSKDWKVRQAAVEGLPHSPTKTEQYAARLASAYLQEPMPRIRSVILDKLKFTQCDEALKTLLDVATSGSPAWNFLIAEAGGRSTAAIRTALAALDSPPDEARFGLAIQMISEALEIDAVPDSTKLSLMSKDAIIELLEAKQSTLKEAFTRSSPGRRIDIALLTTHSSDSECQSLSQSLLAEDSVRREGRIRNALATVAEQLESGAEILPAFVDQLVQSKVSLSGAERERLLMGLADCLDANARTVLQTELRYSASQQDLADYLCAFLPTGSRIDQSLREEILSLNSERFSSLIGHLDPVQGRGRFPAIAKLLLESPLPDAEIEHLLDTLSAHINGYLREGISDALSDAKLDPQKHAHIVRLLLGYLSQPDPNRKAFAISALARSDSGTLQDMIVASAMNDSNYLVTNTLLRVAPQLSSPMFGAFLIEFLSEGSVDIHAESEVKLSDMVSALARKVKFSPPQLRALEQVAENTHLEIYSRLAAFGALAFKSPKGFLRAASAVLAQNSRHSSIDEPITDEEVEASTSAIRNARQIEIELLELLRDVFLEEQIFSSSPDPEQIMPALLKQLISRVACEEDDTIRDLSATALQSCFDFDHQSLNTLLELSLGTTSTLENGKPVDELSEYYATKALCGAGLVIEPEIRDELIALMVSTESSDDIRAEIATSLAHSDDEKPLELFDLLSCERPKVKRATYRGLSLTLQGQYNADLHAERIVPLVKLLSSGSSETRALAAHLLLDINEAREGKFVREKPSFSEKEQKELNDLRSFLDISSVTPRKAGDSTGQART